MLRSRWFVLGVALLLLATTYQVLILAFRILALPRFEIPYVEGSSASCFGRFDPGEWLGLAVLVLGLSWVPLSWAKRRRRVASRCLGCLAVLAGALGSTWLLLVGGAVEAIRSATLAWHFERGIRHPGFDYLSYEALFHFAQVGFGLVALALSLLSLCLRLQQRLWFRTEALAACRAGLLLLLGAALSVRSAWLNEAGCFPFWPALRRDVPDSWSGLWTTSVAFYCGCLLLAFVAWPALRRRAKVLVPAVLGTISAFNDGTWGPYCSCQVVDVPSVPVSALVTTRYPAVRDERFEPSEAVQLGERALRWDGRSFDSAPAFLDELARERERRRELGALLRVTPAPPENLVLRLAPDVPVERLRQVIAAARAMGFAGVTLELGMEPWEIDLGWGLEVPTLNLTRVPVSFADGCACQLELDVEETADAWLQRSQDRLTQGACCFSAAADRAR